MSETIVFYEKPGCITNGKQKSLLRKAGYSLRVENLLAHVWTPAELAPYFKDLSVKDWFNKSAPRVKNGEVDPEKLTGSEALQLLCEDPILIRRPLLSLSGKQVAGFDEYRLRERMDISLTDIRPRSNRHESLEGCSSPEPMIACQAE